jgi:hypothetical protein
LGDLNGKVGADPDAEFTIRATFGLLNQRFGSIHAKNPTGAGRNAKLTAFAPGGADFDLSLQRHG